VLASVGILLAGWEIGAAATATTATSSSAPTTTTTTTTSGADTGSGTTTTATATSVDGTFTGNSVGTRFGNVQVQVTISGGTITDVTALKLTDQDGRSVQISNRAAPILRQQVLASQSANVANVSGATYTSNAYLSSLQSALDQAGL